MLSRRSLPERFLLIADVAMWVAAVCSSITIAYVGFVVTAFAAGGCFAPSIRKVTGSSVLPCAGLFIVFALVSIGATSLAPVGLRVWFSARPAWLSIALVVLSNIIAIYVFKPFFGYGR